MDKVYSYNPIPAVLKEEKAKHILGAQANLWAEYVPTTEHVEYMVFPRAIALAEVNWTAFENKTFRILPKDCSLIIKFCNNSGLIITGLPIIYIV